MAEELETKKISDLPRVQTLSDNDALVGLNQGSDRLFILKALREFIIALHNADPNAHPALSAFITAEANRATAAANTAAISAKLYPTTAAGLAATANGDYFYVASADPNVLNVQYLNSSGTAVFQKSAPSTSALSVVLDDPLRPRSFDTAALDQILIALCDASGNRTWLEANSVDGGPSVWSRNLLGLPVLNDPAYLAVLADANGLYSDLALRAEDGQVADWVMQRWARRLAPLLLAGNTFRAPDVRGSNTTINGQDSYVRNGEVLPVLPNMLQWAGWGSSTIAQFLEMPQVAAGYGATYYNGGQGSELSTHTAARLGSAMALVSGTIAASGASQVTVSNVTPSQFFKSTTGSLGGVAGTLTASDTAWTFTRTSNGSEVVLQADTPFRPDMGLLHRADVTILNMGKNDINASLPVDPVIARCDAAFDWLSPLVKRVIFMGQFGNVGTAAGSYAALSLAKMNQAAKARYGRQFFDLGGYLSSSQVWTDTGISPTSQDLAEQALGNLPPSLSSDNAAHMNATARTAVAAKINQLIQNLGWYA